MDNKKHIQEEVEKTLNSLEGIQRAAANPYLFTRIKARLEREEGIWSRALTFISRPTFAVPAIVLTILINTAIFFEFKSEKVQPSQDVEQAFASEYNLSDNTIYESTIEPE